MARPAATLRYTVLILLQQGSIGLVPLRRLPAGVGEEDALLLHKVGVERAETQVTGILRLLQGVDDVVHLAVIRGTAGLHVGACRLMGMKAVDVCLAKVRARLPLRHPLGDRPTHSAGVGDPHADRAPEALEVRCLPHDRIAVHRESEHAVEGVHQLGVLERRHQLAPSLPRDFVVLRCKRQHGGLPQIAGIDHERLVPVAADPVPVAELTEIHREVLMAQHRVNDLPRLTRKLGKLGGETMEMLGGEQRKGNPDFLPQHRGPDIGAQQHLLGADATLAGQHPRDVSVRDLDVGNRGVADEFRIALGNGVPRQGASRMPSVDVGVARHVEAAQNDALVDERNLLLDLGRGDEKRLHAVGSGPAVAPLQVLQTLGGSGDFDAADRTVERRAVLGILQRSEEFRRVAGELRHHFGRIREKHAARCVGSGTVVLEQGSLVDHEDIAPPQPGQMVGSAATDNAGADDDETSLGTHAVDPPIRTRRPVPYSSCRHLLAALSSDAHAEEHQGACGHQQGEQERHAEGSGSITEHSPRIDAGDLPRGVNERDLAHVHG